MRSISPQPTSVFSVTLFLEKTTLIKTADSFCRLSDEHPPVSQRFAVYLHQPTTSCAHNIQSCHWWSSGNVAQFENKTWWVFSAADSQQSVTSMKPFALTVQIKCSWWKIEADVFPPTLQPKIPKESLNCVCAVFCRDSRVEELGQYYERKYAKPSTGEQWVSLFLGLVKKTHYSIWIFVTWQNRLYGLSSHKASKNSCYTTVKCLSLFFHSRLRPKFICYSQM